MLQVLKNNFRQLLAGKGTFFVILVLPVLLFALSLLVFGDSGGMYQWNVAYVDQDASALSRAMGQMLKGDSNRFLEISQEEADEALMNSQADLAVLVPEGFEASILSAQEPRLVIRSLKGQEITGVMSTSMNLYVADLLRIQEVLSITDGETLAKEYTSVTEQGLQYQEVPLNDHLPHSGLRQASGFLFYVFAMSMLQVASLILKEKQLGTLYRIRQAPVTRLGYISAVFLTGILVLLTNLLSLYLLTTFVFPTTTTLAMYILWFFYGIIWILLGIFLALTVKTSTVYSSLFSIITVISSMLGGSFWPSWMMPDFMQKIAMIVPQHWANNAMESLQQGKTLLQLPENLLALAGFSALFLALAIFALRRSKTAETFV